MNKSKLSNYKKSIIKVTLAVFILLQTISHFHLHLDEHNHTNEHQCTICHISINSFVPNINLNLILVVFGILLIAFNYSPFSNVNNYKYSFTSRSPPLL